MEKKPIYKKWWFWVGIVLVLGIIGKMGQSPDTSSTTTANQVETKKSEEPKKEVNLANFTKIQNGMSLPQVEEIFGKKGEQSSEYGSGEFHMATYSFKGESVFETCSITFQSGKVSGKMQLGLE